MTGHLQSGAPQAVAQRQVPQAGGSSTPPPALLAEGHHAEGHPGKLLSLFARFGGFVSGRSLEGAGFSIPQLVEGRFITRSPARLDAGAYLIGSELERAALAI